MSTPLILEPILGEARRAALAGGLERICRMVVSVEADVGISTQQLASELRGRFRGPLFEGCEVICERTRRGGIQLRSIEGYVTSSPT